MSRDRREVIERDFEDIVFWSLWWITACALAVKVWFDVKGIR